MFNLLAGIFGWPICEVKKVSGSLVMTFYPHQSKLYPKLNLVGLCLNNFCLIEVTSLNSKCVRLAEFPSFCSIFDRSESDILSPKSSLVKTIFDRAMALGSGKVLKNRLAKDGAGMWLFRYS